MIGEKKVWFKLCPELCDGEHWTIADSPRIVAEAVLAWCREFKNEVGEEITIEVIEMTQAEVDAMPEI